MGTTFSTVQIKNSMRMAHEHFIELLCKYFQKKGLTLATQEDFQFSYRLAFSDESNWVTLSLPEYEPGAKCVHEDAEGIAKALRTHCISTSVIDSDVLCLDLFGSSDKQRDAINMGRLDYGIPESKGNQKLWEPLLSDSATWKQIEKIYNKDYTFLEDALTEIAPLFGMDSKNVATDYDSCSDTNNPNVVDLYLKKVGSLGKKAVSLPAAFKQIFGEALEPLGFVKIKGKYPYFVRLIGGEVLHIITYMNEWSGHPDYKNFNILGGVATVYRQRISLDRSPRDSTDWLNNNKYHYFKAKKAKSESISSEYEVPNEFSCKQDDILDVVKCALEVTKEIMLPLFNDVVDLNSCIEYFDKFGRPMTLYDESEDFGNIYAPAHCNEGFLFVVADNCGERYVGFKREERLAKDVRDIFVNDPELYVKALAELERRKVANAEILRSYGLDI